MSGPETVPSLDTGRIADEMQAGGYEPMWIQRDVCVFDIDGTPVAFNSSDAPLTNLVAIHAAKQKHIARALLDNAGVAIAEGQVFEPDQLAEASEYASKLEAPVVLKPTAGRKGRDVTVGVTPGPEFDKAFARSAHSGQQVLVERQFTNADEARFLCVRDECVAVYGKKPPAVVGNGESTILELIDAKNTERRENPHLRNRLIKLTEHRIGWLATRGYTPDDVPPEGTRIVLDLNANVSAGGDSFDRTDDVHPSFKHVAIKAAAAMGNLAPAGVDILAHDFNAPATSENYIVCEVNSRPALGAHHYPAQGTARNAAGAIARHTLQAVRDKEFVDPSVQIPAPAPSDSLPRADEVPLGEFYNGDAQLIALELMRRDIEVCWLSRKLFLTKVSGSWFGFSGTASHLTASPGRTIAGRKDSVRQCMEHYDLEVARGRFFAIRGGARGPLARASKFATSLGTVVVKPTDGRRASGLTLGVRDTEQFEQAWIQAAAVTNHGVVVEEEANGTVARFLVVGHHCVAVRRRSDSTGADLTDEVHDSFKVIAVRAAHAIPGLELASVDIIAPDFTRPPGPGDYVVVDVDSTPRIWPYHFPANGEPRDVARAIVDHHLAQAEASRSRRARTQRLATLIRSKVRATFPAHSSAHITSGSTTRGTISASKST